MPDIHTHQPEPDHEEQLFLRFANTRELSRGEPIEHLPDVGALLDWLREERLLSSRGRAAEAGRLRRDDAECRRRLDRFRHLRSLLHEIAADMSATGTPRPAQVSELNHILRHGLHYHQLRHEARGPRYTVAQVGDRLDQARAAIAGSFAHFLADDDAERLRVCANEGCRYLFVDRSPTGRRRWCDMRTCGNQAKAARHRARQRAVAAVGVPPSSASV